MFVNETGLDNISTVKEFTIAQIAIEEEIKSTKISGNKEYQRLTKFVDNNLLGALRIQLEWNKSSVLYNKKYGFENRIILLVKFFQEYITDNDIDVVCIDLVSPFTSLECRVLEKVCDEMGVKKLISSKSSLYGRIELFDNTKRISRVADANYKSLLSRGIKKSELEKLESFLKSYKIKKKRFHGDSWLTKLQNQKNPNIYNIRNIVKNLKNTLIDKGTKNLNIKHRNITEFSNKPYFVFLPNKKNNHRTYNCSPFHSDYPALIRAISISLPIGYSLLIKEHPHQIRKKPNNDLLKAIMSTDNCHYLSIDTDYYDLLENAVGIFSTASTTAIESLMARKHVIVFGSEPYVYGSNILAPIHRITNLEKLPVIINSCISTPVEKDKINAYLFSLISSSSSSPTNRANEETDFLSLHPEYKQKEYVHIVKMINKLIQ
jgi:hypothetical protein